jgi:DNA polymerase-3 subunit gamma/tau
VVELIRANRDVRLLVDVEDGVQLVSYQPGRIEFCPSAKAPQDLAQRLGSALQRWTGNRWGVSVVSDGGAPTIAEARDAERLELEASASAHPMVQAVQSAFPGARITQIRTLEEQEAEAEAEALQEVEDEWDPFEED